VDDGSEREFPDVVRSMRDPRFAYHRLERHENANVARNYGILHSRGAYIAMLDSDDEWLPNHLEASLRLLEAEKADGVYGSLILRGAASTDRVVTTRRIGDGESTIDFLLSTGYGAQTSTLVMTAGSARATGWDANLGRHQDYDFVTRYRRRYKLAALLEPTVVYHQSAGPKAIDFHSCIRFIRGVEDEISPRIFLAYHRQMLRLAMSLGAEAAVLRHYREAVAGCVPFVSLTEHLTLLGPKNGWEAWKMKTRYLWRLLLLRVET
jgi:glycosyltransferase involved in cell wall biosynthesis